MVQHGFAGALDRVWPQIEGQLETLDLPVLYTGHGVGGALATLAASRRPPETLYTFGAPPVGDKAFAAALGRKEGGTVAYRYINCCDAVAHLPPAAYQPVGKLRYIDSNGRLRDDAEDEAARAAARNAHFRKTLGQWDKVWVRDLVDHAPVNYVTALLAAQ